MRVIGFVLFDKGVVEVTMRPSNESRATLTLPRTLALACGLGAALSTGCTLDALEPADDASLDDAPIHERVGEDDVADVLAQVCDPKVHIARRDLHESCGSGLGWLGEPLFDVGTPWLENQHKDAVEPELARYCQYTWQGPGEPSDAQIDALYATVGSEPDPDPIAPSCRAIQPQTNALTTALGPLLRELFWFNSGRPSAADLGLPASGTPEPLVTVLVVDSHPRGQLHPRSNHGRHMGNVIADVACPDDDPDCRVEVEYVLALPRIAGGAVDYEHGGRVGTHGDLAAAIYEGVKRWKQANANRTVASHLVLNLSLAWEPAIFGGDEPDPDPAIGAIREALDLAYCEGALIVASAGNQGDYCNVSGPTGPAFWETRPAPSQARCADFGIAIPPPGNGYRPLVHAVGGLDLERGPLPHARVGANPRLLAAAAHVAAGDPLYGGLSGTSVATATTSAAAALVWAHRPNLPAAAVMSWVYAGGEPLDELTTDFGLGPVLMQPRRVDACAALQAACAGPGVTCPAMPLVCFMPDVPETSDLADALAAVLPPQVVERTLTDIDQCVDSCGNAVDVHVEAGESSSCNGFAVDPAEALVNPTPDSIGCSTCGLTTDTLALSTSSDFDAAEVTGVLVRLKDAQGVWHPYDLGPVALSSNSITPVKLVPPPPKNIVAGEISITFGQLGTTTDPLLIL